MAHAHLWWRLVRSTTRTGRGRRRLTAVFAVLVLRVTFALVVSYPPKVLLPVQWAGFIWLGVAFYVIVALLALEPVRLGARPWLRRRDRRPRPSGTVDEAAAKPAISSPAESRRLFLARGLAVGAGAVALGAAGVGVRSANGSPVVRWLPVVLPRLDPSLDGFRVVTFSDAHLSSIYGGRRFERVVELVNAQQPDIVAIVGDLVDGELEHLREEVAPVGDLASAHGVFSSRATTSTTSTRTPGCGICRPSASRCCATSGSRSVARERPSTSRASTTCRQPAGCSRLRRRSRGGARRP